MFGGVPEPLGAKPLSTAIWRASSLSMKLRKAAAAFLFSAFAFAGIAKFETGFDCALSSPALRAGGETKVTPLIWSPIDLASQLPEGKNRPSPATNRASAFGGSVPLASSLK